MNGYALTQYEGLLSQRWWSVPKSKEGRWVYDFSKARKYASEMAAHIAWTAVSRKFNLVKCVPYPEVKL